MPYSGIEYGNVTQDRRRGIRSPPVRSTQTPPTIGRMVDGFT
ncbi:hypothetical protein [Planctomonas sp. JC2975]|nr:hypothetical protein [Planctomonas sp. JC2975]